ncbi:hypothetical protein HK102_014004 [Quaeritorhiza haematococci]|nr:hypothetical protein HK102_014004 [Quaeritorhiza haematococci]
MGNSNSLQSNASGSPYTPPKQRRPSASSASTTSSAAADLKALHLPTPSSSSATAIPSGSSNSSASASKSGSPKTARGGTSLRPQIETKAIRTRKGEFLRANGSNGVGEDEEDGAVPGSSSVDEESVVGPFEVEDIVPETKGSRSLAVGKVGGSAAGVKVDGEDTTGRGGEAVTAAERAEKSVKTYVQPPHERSYKNSARIVHAFGPGGLAPLAPLSSAQKELNRRDSNVVPVMLTWTQGGRIVYVTGTFNNWKQKIRMNRSEVDFTTVVDLPKGTHRFKFIVDDEWKCSDDLPMASDADGNLVNYLEVTDDAGDSQGDGFDGFSRMCDTGRVPSRQLHVRDPALPHPTKSLVFVHFFQSI